MTGPDLQQEAPIFVLVEATDHQTAISRGKSSLDEVVSAVYRPVESFRDYKMFHDDGKGQLRERWGEKPAAASLDSKEGQALLEDAVERMETIFDESIEAIEKSLELYSRDELMQNAENVRLHFLRLGATVGPSVPLYSEDSYPIRNEADLERFREMHGEIWIVPAIGMS